MPVPGPARPLAPSARRRAVFSAVADPVRRAILDRLRAGPLPAGQIAAAFTVSRPAISRHLRVLRRARLVSHHKRGRLRLYTLTPQPLQLVDDWLTAYRLFWAARLLDLKEFVESHPDATTQAAPLSPPEPPRTA